MEPELIACNELDIELYQLPNLLAHCDMDAMLQPDCRGILVDEAQYWAEKSQNRIRFSLAHELGHVALHQKIMLPFRRLTLKEWFDLHENKSDDNHRWFEWQASEFAGRPLVPLDELRSEL